jgi:hypothetical protein
MTSCSAADEGCGLAANLGKQNMVLRRLRPEMILIWFGCLTS